MEGGVAIVEKKGGVLIIERKKKKKRGVSVIDQRKPKKERKGRYFAEDSGWVYGCGCGYEFTVV